MTAYPKNVRYITAYKRMSEDANFSWYNKTYISPSELVELIQGKKKFYFVPYGSGYNCEDGVFVDIISEEEFIHKYSLTILE